MIMYSMLSTALIIQLTFQISTVTAQAAHDYISTGGSLDWYLADRHCVDLAYDSLAVIPTDDDYAALRYAKDIVRSKRFRISDGVPFWVGLYQNASGEFAWIDGAPCETDNGLCVKDWLVTPDFNPNHTDYCATLTVDSADGTRGYKADLCDTNHRFMCSLMNETTTEPTVNPTLPHIDKSTTNPSVNPTAYPTTDVSSDPTINPNMLDMDESTANPTTYPTVGAPTKSPSSLDSKEQEESASASDESEEEDTSKDKSEIEDESALSLKSSIPWIIVGCAAIVLIAGIGTYYWRKGRGRGSFRKVSYEDETEGQETVSGEKETIAAAFVN